MKDKINEAINTIKDQLHLTKKRVTSLEKYMKKINIEIDLEEKIKYKEEYMKIETSKYPILESLQNLYNPKALKNKIIKEMNKTKTIINLEELLNKNESLNLELYTLIDAI